MAFDSGQFVYILFYNRDIRLSGQFSMHIDKLGHIEQPMFSCCYEYNEKWEATSKSPYPLKFTLHSKAADVDPKYPELKSNLSANLVGSAKLTSASQHPPPKNADKYSITHKKSKEFLLKSVNSPKNQSQKINLKYLRKQSFHELKSPQNIQEDKETNEKLMKIEVYDSQHEQDSPLRRKLSDTFERQSLIKKLEFGAVSCKNGTLDSPKKHLKLLNNKKLNQLQSKDNLSLNRNMSQSPLRYQKANNVTFNHNSGHRVASQRQAMPNVQFFKSNKDFIETHQERTHSKPSFIYPRKIETAAQNVRSQSQPHARIQPLSPYLNGNSLKQAKTQHSVVPPSPRNILAVPSHALIESKFEQRTVEDTNPEEPASPRDEVIYGKRKMMPPRKSDLEMIKASCISEVDDSPEEPVNEAPKPIIVEQTYKIQVRPEKQPVMVKKAEGEHQKSNISFAPSVKNSLMGPQRSILSKLGTSKASYKYNFPGLSFVTVNSFAEEVNQSKIQQKIQESVVMQDFFNPAKTLLNKWGQKEDTNPEYDQ